MTVINLKRYYYPLVKTDVFVEVPDEIADALLHLRREENNRTSKIWYHKAYFSLDCEDGIENDAIGWARNTGRLPRPRESAQRRPAIPCAGP